MTNTGFPRSLRLYLMMKDKSEALSSVMWSNLFSDCSVGFLGVRTLCAARTLNCDRQTARSIPHQVQRSTTQRIPRNPDARLVSPEHREGPSCDPALQEEEVAACFAEIEPPQSSSQAALQALCVQNTRVNHIRPIFEICMHHT